VAGIPGAAANNGGTGPGDGIAGLAYNCQVMPIKAIDDTGNGTEEDLANGILWAVDHGAAVTNISAGDY
jgi:subtilisin family serine protease